MSLQSVAALFKIPAAPPEECSGARGVGAAVTALSLLGEETVLAGQMRHRWGVPAFGPWLLSQSEYCVLLVMLNRKTCSRSRRRMEAEGETGRRGTLS